MVPFLIYQLFGFPLALTTAMILLISLGTDIFPAISFAYEKKEGDIMLRLPRNPDTDKLVTWKLILFAYAQIGAIQTFAGFFSYFVVLTSFGFPPLTLYGLDYDGVFAWEASSTAIKNAYWLYCYDHSYSSKCFYFPDLGNTIYYLHSSQQAQNNFTSSDWTYWATNSKTNYMVSARNFLNRKAKKFTSDNVLEYSYTEFLTFWNSYLRDDFFNKLQIIIFIL